MKRIYYLWLVPILGCGVAMWCLVYSKEMADPLIPYSLAHRLAIAGGLIFMVLSAFRQYGKPLRERLRGYYRTTLPAALFAIIIGGNAHWFTRPYFEHSPARISPDGFILQSTGLSCAPAAIANLVRLYGMPAWEGELAITMRMPFTGSGIGEIERGLASHGFAFTDTHTTLAGLWRNNRPCLISIWIENGLEHSCVLLAMTDEQVWLVDPRPGLMVLTIDRFSQCWSGWAIFAVPPGAPILYDFRQPFDLKKVRTWLKAEPTS